jgi:transcriptional regulator with XRE-family HTH domain
LPKREQEVCARLRQAREFLNFSQEEFAAQIRITRQRLASYEEKRVALRSDIGLRICHQFILGEEWLATGGGWMRQCMDLACESVAHQVPLDAPYGETFEKYLAPTFQNLKSKNPGIRVNSRHGDGFERMENMLRFLIHRWFKEIPTAKKMPDGFESTLCACLISAGQDFVDFVSSKGEMPSPDELDAWMFPSRTLGAAKKRTS